MVKDALSEAAKGVSRVAVRGLVFVLRLYQAGVSPLLGPCCRYTPSCSEYAVQALRAHGLARGTLLAAWRILRCHPLAEGGYDPVPPARHVSPVRRRGDVGRG